MTRSTTPHSSHSSDATNAEISAWFHGRLPAEWTEAGLADIEIDREEITVTLTLPAPSEDGETSEPAVRAQAIAGRAAGFRDDTRDRRMAVARDAEHRFDRKVAWAVRIDEERHLFTHLAVPVMTRLRQPERQVLDTLVSAGVARSRADALAWCVRLVGRNTETWLADLRSALHDVERLRSEGPDTAG
jgi:hypothetical protein